MYKAIQYGMLSIKAEPACTSSFAPLHCPEGKQVGYLQGSLTAASLP